MKTLKTLAVIAIIGIAISAFAINEVVYGKKADGKKIEGYSIGDIATDFSLKNIDDKMVSLVDYKDAKGYVVIFTCCLLYTSPSPRDRQKSRMPSSA